MWPESWNAAEHAVTAADDWGANFAGTGMAAYERALVAPLFVPWAEHLLDVVGVGIGDAVLDVACGPGTVARLAATRTGRSGAVVGCDLSDEMLDIARAKSDVGGGAAIIDYRRCPADSLRVDTDAFDVAVCQQGLQFFPDRVAALAEMRRALRGRGRAAASVWCEVASCEPFAALEAAIDEVFGQGDAAGYSSGPWGLTDAAVLERDMIGAGFCDVEVRRDEMSVAFRSVEDLIDTLGAAPIGAKVQQLDASGRHAFRAAVERATAPLIVNGAITGRTAAHTVTGTA